ncbi:glycosyl transferase [Actinoplanes cyaneus]|uniref:Glycosyl transferase n=1 Tax=Actinoplanes cyaneus TaxID=52696 RepID=A0A919ICC9_9ACTN|nr:DUF2079 domain-containing protein [Actinoplanes cyaneus]MCW2137123.1 hypothetical protein [Actinoplanes cyaneus]GID63174.1 glycosyl transferase [Actinoplanes cyaneus]
MSVAAPAPASSADPPSETSATPGTKPREWPVHLSFAVVALSFAVYVTSGLWRDPFTHVLSDNVGDQAFFEWLMGYGYYTVTQGSDPFFAQLLNAPLGVNLAANTSITVYTVLMTPVTHFAGPQISFVTVLTLNLAGSAFVWYLFLRRWLVKNAVAAAVAGLFCGFAPGFISHANGHLNWTAGWVAPVVVWQVLKLREEGRLRWLRNGVVLGLLLAVGFSIAAEGLFFTALGSGVFVLAWSLSKAVHEEARAALPRVAAALGVTAVVAGSLLAYPLYMHFAGPQTFSGTGFNQDYFAEDAAAYLSYANRSLGGLFGWHADVAPNRTEETSFFGVPLVLLMIVAFVLLWRRSDPGRRATLRAVGIVGLFYLVLSLGPVLHVNKHFFNGFPMPYKALKELPLFDSALPSRFALGVVGVFGILLALLIDQLLAKRPSGGLLNTALAAAIVVSLLPVVPLPLRIQHRAPEPAFIADGLWKNYVTEGGSLSSLPFAMNVTADGQRWQAYTMARGGQQFKIPDGYFLGPQTTGEEGKKQAGRIGSVPLATDWLFLRAAWYGYVASLSNADRAQARADFEYWGLDAVFLAPEITGSDHQPLNRAAVEETARDLLGEPEQVGGVLVWRIRRGVDPVDR